MKDPFVLSLSQCAVQNQWNCTAWSSCGLMGLDEPPTPLNHPPTPPHPTSKFSHVVSANVCTHANYLLQYCLARQSNHQVHASSLVTSSFPSGFFIHYILPKSIHEHKRMWETFCHLLLNSHWQKQHWTSLLHNKMKGKWNVWLKNGVTLWWKKNNTVLPKSGQRNWHIKYADL